MEKNRYLLLLLILFSSLLILFSCAPTLVTNYESGRPIDPSKINQIIDNKTTESDVIALLGPPQNTQERPDGAKILIYSHYHSQMSGPSVGDLKGGISHEMLFIGVRNGIVKKKWQNSSSTPTSSSTSLRGPLAPSK